MTRRAAIVCLVLCLGLVGALVARADDVPDDARKLFTKAKTYVAAGDMKKAFSSLSKAKTKAGDSLDFWLLYVKVYRSLGRKEATLWDKIIAKAEAKHAKSPNFHLLRYRLASEFEERVKHLKAAIANDPDAVGPQLMLAREYVKNEDETEAEEILDAVLEKDPGNEIALVTKGEMMISSGFSRSAIDFAEESLEKNKLPGLHDLAARGYMIVAENDESAFEKAAEHAKKAVALRPDPEFVLTYATVLDHTGKTEEAVKVLSENHAKTSSPLVAGRLGELAFRTGDYDKALKGLQAAAPDSAEAAKALALVESRRGRAKQARAAVEHVLRHDPEEKLTAVEVEILLGDYAKALKLTEGLDGDEGEYVRLACLARMGKTAEASSIAAERSKDGSRMAEEWLLELALAQVTAKMGGEGAKAWKALTEGRWAAAKAGTPTATLPEYEPNILAKSFGFMQRMASYRRALDGTYFRPMQMFVAPTKIDGEDAIGVGVISSSDCERDAGRIFPFNAKKREGDSITINLEDQPEIWEAANAAFKEGCAALVAGDAAKADEAFGKALEQEASWGRAKLFQAVARVMLGTDLAGAATLAKEAVTVLPDDWEGRALGILIRMAAGEAPTAELKALSEREESYCPRLFDEL